MLDGNANKSDEQAKSQVEFLWKVHDYLGDNIKFSDTKAAFLVAFSSGLIASLVTHEFTGALHPWNTSKPVEKIVVGLAYFGFAALAVSISLAMLSVLPRLWTESKPKATAGRILRAPFAWAWHVIFPKRSDRPKRPLFWEDITAFENNAAYIEFAGKLAYSDQIAAIGNNIHIRAGICQRKFRLVNASIFFALLGAIDAAIMIAFYTS